MAALIDLVGQKFGRLLVLRFANRDKWRTSRWLCRCSCGIEKIVRGTDLTSGHTKSCGCVQKEVITKHGHRAKGKESKIYAIWQGMIQRCTNPKNIAYCNYGGRGIKVCKRWMKFINFLKDMGEKPIGYQIDRIDNNKGYSKSNCRWVTAKTNCRNKRNNHLETHMGKTQCLAAWAEEVDIHKTTFRDRIVTLGWSVEKALTTPVQGQSGTSLE